MKKISALLLAVLMLLLCLSGCGEVSIGPEIPDASKAPVNSEAPDEENTRQETADTVATTTIDFEKIYESHDSDELVMTVNGQEVLWDEYFYWFFTNAGQISAYITNMNNNGYAIDWEDTASADGSDFYQLVNSTVESSLMQVYSIFGFAAENGVELSDADRATIEAQLKSDITALCGEDGTEEQFNEALELAYMNRKIYDQIQQANYLYQAGFNTLYGVNGELVEAEDAIAYLEEMEYMCANHILLLTKDMETGEALDDETVAEKKAEADKLAAELQAISDPEELVKRFTELKVERCEDSGKIFYPDGYTFTTGKMVAEFENTCLELEEYEVSDPVKTDYGYHIIIGLPLNPDMPIEYSSAGTPLTARSFMANEAYGIVMQAYLNNMEFKYADGFEPIVLKDFFKTAE